MLLEKLHRRMARKRLELSNSELALIFSMADRKAAFVSLATYYEKADPFIRSEIRAGWNFNLKWIVPERNTLAQFKVGDLAPGIKIRINFIFWLIATSDDNRDDLSAYAYIYHSALEAGMNVNQLFKEMAEMADSSRSDLITGFINRPEEDKSLAAWRMIKIVEPDGPRFEFVG